MHRLMALLDGVGLEITWDKSSVHSPTPDEDGVAAGIAAALKATYRPDGITFAGMPYGVAGFAEGVANACASSIAHDVDLIVTMVSDCHGGAAGSPPRFLFQVAVRLLRLCCAFFRSCSASAVCQSLAD